jgi:hypothetical protein
MTDTDHQIIRLLTELRDSQREELAYRRGVLEESLGLQRRAVRNQRIAFLVGLGLILVVAAASVLVGLARKLMPQTTIVEPVR